MTSRGDLVSITASLSAKEEQRQNLSRKTRQSASPWGCTWARNLLTQPTTSRPASSAMVLFVNTETSKPNNGNPTLYSHFCQIRLREEKVRK